FRPLPAWYHTASAGFRAACGAGAWPRPFPAVHRPGGPPHGRRQTYRARHCRMRARGARKRGVQIATSADGGSRMSSTDEMDESRERRRTMLRTAMGSAIAEALADPLVIEIMVNP